MVAGMIGVGKVLVGLLGAAAFSPAVWLSLW